MLQELIQESERHNDIEMAMAAGSIGNDSSDAGGKLAAHTSVMTGEAFFFPP